LRIRVIKLPERDTLEGYDVSHFALGATYDVTPTFAALLVVMGYAYVELRQFDREPGRPFDRHKG
jgi:hypothetical protein